jgi:hypothetical protein
VDSLNGGAVSEDGAKECVARALLGAAVHFLPVFLIDESYCNVLGCRKEAGVRGLDELL